MQRLSIITVLFFTLFIFGCVAQAPSGDLAILVGAESRLADGTLTSESGGKVTSETQGISCGADCSETYSLDNSIVLTATANSGWQFVGWSGACIDARTFMHHQQD